MAVAVGVRVGEPVGVPDALSVVVGVWDMLRVGVGDLVGEGVLEAVGVDEPVANKDSEGVAVWGETVGVPEPVRVPVGVSDELEEGVGVSDGVVVDVAEGEGVGVLDWDEEPLAEGLGVSVAVCVAPPASSNANVSTQSTLGLRHAPHTQSASAVSWLFFSKE